MHVAKVTFVTFIPPKARKEKKHIEQNKKAD